MRRTLVATYLSVLVLLIFSCRKELKQPDWETHIITPLAYSSLSLGDILPDSLISENPDSSISIAFLTTLFELDLDSILQIPDTIFRDTFQLPLAVPTVAVNPGQIIFSQNDVNTFDVENVELTEAKLRTGRCEFTISSTVDQPITLTYNIPSATLNGQAFQAVITVPAGSQSNPAVYSSSFDLNDYDLYLRGSSGTSFNEYQTSFNVKLANSASPTNVTNQDKVTLDTRFVEMSPFYAKGYFGQRSLNGLNEESDLDLFNQIVAGNIDLDAVSVLFNLHNGIGAEARVVLNDLTAIRSLNGNSVSLSHAIIGSVINLNRATRTGWNVSPANYPISLTNLNSNIDQLLENLPDKISSSFEVELNPLGNVSAHNDFLVYPNTFQADMDIRVPLSIITDSLTLTDTLNVELNTGENGSVNRGTFTLKVDNGFPFDADLKLGVMDASGVVQEWTGADQNIVSAAVNAQNNVIQTTHSELKFTFSENAFTLLKENKKLVVIVSFDTVGSGRVTLYSHYKMDLHLSGDLYYRTGGAE